MDVTVMSNANGVDNALNWQEAFVYSGRRLEDGQTFLGNTLRFNESLPPKLKESCVLSSVGRAIDS